LALVATFLGLAFAGLVARLAYLQVVRQEDLGAIAVDNTSREMLFEPRRGDILDAKGNLLATSIFVKTVCADPTLLGHQQTLVARALAPVLEMPEAGSTSACCRACARPPTASSSPTITSFSSRRSAPRPGSRCSRR
jgi:hypothetical protein